MSSVKVLSSFHSIDLVRLMIFSFLRSFAISFHFFLMFLAKKLLSSISSHATSKIKHIDHHFRCHSFPDTSSFLRKNSFRKGSLKDMFLLLLPPFRLILYVNKFVLPRKVPWDPRVCGRRRKDELLLHILY